LWDEAQQRLWWVDIYGKRLLSHDPKSQSYEAHELPDVIGTVVICLDGRPLIAQACGVAQFDPRTKSLTRLVDLDCNPQTHRLNDGKCDPRGRLWIGTMVEHGEAGTAALYCVSADKSVVRLLQGVTISNGLAWADGGKRFYYVDTPTQQVVSYDCDLSQPSLSNRHVVFEFPPDMGSPDGMTIDAEGQLWVALFGGGSVVRLDPRSGQLTGRVLVGAKNITSCAFGGPGLRTLYISTARLATSDAELLQMPRAGALFEVTLPVHGVPSVRFGSR
jgi:sugar lactone lactonase YvrE